MRSLFYLEAHGNGLKSEQLKDYLIGEGAILNDGVDFDGTVTPAWQDFYAETGKIRSLSHWHEGEPCNGLDGDPSEQWYNPDGTIRYAKRWTPECDGTLDERELAEFAAKKSVISRVADVPENLRQNLVPTLRPA